MSYEGLLGAGGSLWPTVADRNTSRAAPVHHTPAPSGGLLPVDSVHPRHRPTSGIIPDGSDCGFPCCGHGLLKRVLENSTQSYCHQGHSNTVTLLSF